MSEREAGLRVCCVKKIMTIAYDQKATYHTLEKGIQFNSESMNMS